MEKQFDLNKREEKVIKEISDLKIDIWRTSYNYSEKIVPMIVGVSTPKDWNHALDVQLAYQEGMIEMYKLLNNIK
jgi:hypothetical protein